MNKEESMKVLRCIVDKLGLTGVEIVKSEHNSELFVIIKKGTFKERCMSIDNSGTLRFRGRGYEIDSFETFSQLLLPIVSEEVSSVRTKLEDLKDIEKGLNGE